jgi:hypothetical protein
VNDVLLALVMVGGCVRATFKVNDCAAFGEMPFCAVIVMGYVPMVPAAGVPLSIPVAAVNVTPVGSVPVSLSVGAGKPVAVTVNVPAKPSTKVALFALVIAGAWSTVSVKVCVPSAPAPLWAMIVNEYVPPLPAAGVPLSVPVVASVTPLGSAPVSLMVGAGNPVAVTVNVPAVPTVKVVLVALVIAAGWFTVSVKVWTASAPAPLCAVNVMV